jgi:acetolactate synthase-1/2/3 large subunit
MNNASLGLVFQQQTMFYGERIYASKFKGMPDFVRVAEGFGVPPSISIRRAIRVPRWPRRLSTRGPMLIHASIAMHEQVLPMVPPGAANKEMIGG